MWEDIIERGKFGYGYSDIDSAVESVLHAFEDKAIEDKIKVKALQFTEEKFESKFLNILGLK